MSLLVVRAFVRLRQLLKANQELAERLDLVDFEGGGRMECYMTDVTLDQLEIGKEVEMTFRKMRVEDGVHIYFWKATLPRA